MDAFKRLSAKRDRPSCKPNIIPILDAVFIFIFFLLMSAEFIRFYVIHSDAPAIKMVSTLGSDQNPPLNLALEILPDRIIVKTNPEGEVSGVLYTKDGDYDWDGLSGVVRTLKRKYVEENSIILRPYPELPYKKVVEFIDILRALPPGAEPITTKNTKGETVRTSTLFDRVIFEGDV